MLVDEDSQSNSNDYARITDVEYKAIVVDEVGSNGKIIVTERLTFDIHAASASNPFWELWRDLPEATIDGVKVDYKVNSVRQIVDGVPIEYAQSPKLYWDDYDYISPRYGPNHWYHSPGPYNEASRFYECVFFYINGVYRDEMVFEIEYEMNNAALRYNDCSELYLTFYSEETINYLESFKGEILIPDKDMPAKGCYDAHTYGTDSYSFPFKESTTKNPGYHTFIVDLDQEDLQFSPYNEYIEFTLLSYGNDKHSFTDYASINDYYYDNVLNECRAEQKYYENLPQLHKTAKTTAFIICAAIAFLAIRSAKNYDATLRKKHTFYEPTIQVEYFRDIPSDLDPNFAASLVFSRSKKKNDESDVYAALMLSLVRKGYIELERINPSLDWTNNNVKIVIKNKPIDLVNDELEAYLLDRQDTEQLSTNEEAYFNLIAKYAVGNEISMELLQNRISLDYLNTDAFVGKMDKSIVNIGVSQGYFQKANYQLPRKQVKSKASANLVWAILIFILGNVISFQTPVGFAYGGYCLVSIALMYTYFILNKNAEKYVLFTQFGEDEYAKWKGLYDFLNSETLMNERTVVELPLWEQYLVYATAFGISDKVTAALKIRCPEMYNSPLLSNSYYTSHNFRLSSRSFRTSARTASHAARMGGGYSGSGGHGGYGGGGRGGGGGRRRSLISTIKGMNIIHSFIFYLQKKSFACIFEKSIPVFSFIVSFLKVLYIVFEIYFSAIFIIFLYSLMSSGKYIPPFSLFLIIQHTAANADIATGVIVGVCQYESFSFLYKKLFSILLPTHTGLNFSPISNIPTYSVPSSIFSLYKISANLGYLYPLTIVSPSTFSQSNGLFGSGFGYSFTFASSKYLLA